MPSTGMGLEALLLQAFDVKGLAFYLIPLVVGEACYFSGRYSTRISEWIKGPALDEAEAKKLAAKRTNDHLKLFASFCNTVGAAIIGAALIVPYLTQHNTSLDAPAFVWGLFGAALHIVGHGSLRFMRSEG